MSLPKNIKIDDEKQALGIFIGPRTNAGVIKRRVIHLTYFKLPYEFLKCLLHAWGLFVYSYLILNNLTCLEILN